MRTDSPRDYRIETQGDDPIEVTGKHGAPIEVTTRPGCMALGCADLLVWAVIGIIVGGLLIPGAALLFFALIGATTH